jgi:hypothetical protein
MPRTPCMLLCMIVALVTLISPSPTPADEPAMTVPGTGVIVAETEGNDWTWPHDSGHMWEEILPHPSYDF